MRIAILFFLAWAFAGCSSKPPVSEDRAKAARERVKQAENAGMPR